MNLPQLYADFEFELRNYQGYLTEDGVRYIFFACMLRQDRVSSHYVLEHPYNLLSSNPCLSVNTSPLKTTKGSLTKELDLFYEDQNECLCFEFKFHRRATKSTLPHTNAAGSILNDLQRLQLISATGTKPVRKLFVYVTDDEMHKYFMGNTISSALRIPMKTFYASSVGNVFSISVSGLSNSMQEHVFKSFSAIAPSLSINGIAKAFDADFSNPNISSIRQPGKCHVRIYEA